MKPGIEQLYELFLQCGRVSTDSRRVERGALFFALKGESFNGNDYAAAALGNGAGHVVIDNPAIYSTLRERYGERVSLVENSLTALQQLSKYNRLKHKLPVIAITGTNGKTTTKELINAVLSKRYKTVCTEGNLNNHIGVPLTLLRIDNTTEVAIVEMGASAPGEIAALAELVCPSFGLITNVGRAHLLGFGSFEGVKRTKGELYADLERHKKVAFVNVDNPDLMEMLGHYPSLHIVPYGIKNNNVKVEFGSGTPYLKLTFPAPDFDSAKQRSEVVVNTRLIGRYNADNVLAAICVALYFDVPARDAVEAVEGYIPSNNRSQLKNTERNTLIIDAYNANPTSMRAALENFREMDYPVKSLILGDMLELGVDSLNEHKTILSLAIGLGAETLYLVGEEFGKAFGELSAEKGRESAAKGVKLFKDSLQLREYLEKERPQGRCFLIKGSRGTKLERVLEAL